jgi:acetylornithine deacetylase
MLPNVEQLLAELVQIPSVNPRGGSAAAEEQLASFVADWMRRAGCDVVVDEVLPGRPNVLARIEGVDRHRVLLLEGHLDTVEVDGMTVAPFGGEVRSGRLFGRGSTDAKGSLAAFMAAMADLTSSGEVPPATVMLAAVVDEEHHFRGVTHLLATNRETISGAIVGEPTELRMVVAHKGCLRFQVRAIGRSAHSSEPWTGDNAIETMADAVIQIRDELGPRTLLLQHPLVGPATLTVTLIAGGSGVNLVPESCTIHIDRRIIPGEDPTLVWAEIKSALTAGRSGRLEVVAPDLVDFPLEGDASSGIARVLSASLLANSLTPDAVGAPYGTDASKLGRAGIPSVVFGPGTIGDAHRPDESIELREVERAAATLADVLRRFGAEPR